MNQNHGLYIAAALLTVMAHTTTARAQPAAGWHDNSAVNKPHTKVVDDDAGLIIDWDTSYVYQTPVGAGNLYWYAQIVYRNFGNQNITLTCSGLKNPNLAKENIRGTEGIASNSFGYVPADETFCSRNPTFSGVLKPGASHYSWAIFHNVPPGGEVSIQWGLNSKTFGTSAWVNPWSIPYKPGTLPPEVCPTELVNLGTCRPLTNTACTGQDCKHSADITNNPYYPVVESLVDCAADLTVSYDKGLNPRLVSYVKRIKGIGTRLGATIAYEDFGSGNLLLATLEGVRLLPYESCVEVIPNLVVPGQLPALTKCFEQKTNDEKMCVQYMREQGLALLGFVPPDNTSTLPSSALPNFLSSTPVSIQTTTISTPPTTTPQSQFYCVNLGPGSCGIAR